MRLRQRLFSFAGTHTCLRRGTAPLVSASNGIPDRWNIGPDGNRTCSYCGSIHFDDLMAVCAKVVFDDRYAIEGTDKAYKVYVRQPGVVNAAQGAIKFYKHHVPNIVTEAERKLYDNAYQLSCKRFRLQLDKFARRL